MEKIKGSEMRVGLPPFREIAADVLQRLLDPEQSPLTAEERAILRTKLNLPAEMPGPATGTNAPPVSAGTNAPVSNATHAPVRP